MERDFNTDEFELFLKQKTDQYKIYPSEKSWKNIHRSLHSRWKWFTVGGSGLILLAGLYFFSNDLGLSSSTKPSIQAFSPDQSSASKNAVIDTKIISALQPIGSISLKSVPNSGRSSSSQLIGISSPGNSGDDKPNVLSSHLSSTIAAAPGSEPKASLLTARDTKNTIQALATDLPVKQYEAEGADLKSKIDMQIIPLIETKAAISGEINWMEEMAAIKLSARKKNPFNLQFYFSPSVSYRRLADNKPSGGMNQQYMPVASANTKIDRFVDHKPSIGAELGSNILFAAGRNLTFKTGLQLNYSRYTIKAYKFYFEKASIALNSMGPIADTITSYTSFRNFSGYSPEELQNQYLQISVPIGAELKLLGNKRLQFNIAGSIQPTYLLLNSTYLLSTDYVNYAREPSLVRKWNVHSSMEAFVSYKLGGIRWQVGPQFRYQLMSSFNDRYPIKEYLFEYGVKVGVSKTIR